MRSLLMLTAAASLAACAPRTFDGGNEATPAATATTPADRDEARAPQPVPVAAVAQLTGELRCAFSAGGQSLLVAAADVDRTARATAVVAPGGRVALVTADAPGGFGALTRGGLFRGQGVEATLARGAEQPTDHEGSRHAATLSVVSGGAAAPPVPGVWECGP